MSVKVNENKNLDEIISDMKKTAGEKDQVFNLQIKYNSENMKDEVLNDLLKKMKDTQLQSSCLTYVCGTFCCKLL